ncbi:SLBB domain-containing protein [Flavisolibacter tropicus]|uniref:SLBB domain-containing protein n=1 Tax=Flavisolibacter tropicus TaxID=1492898 RepID=UPI00082BB37D|nr:SLBB domain-containing protein [Flavisolibacter tropicus]
MNCFRGLFVLLLCFVSVFAFAQIPSDLSAIKASQIPDAQLQQYLAQAKAKGITLDQLEAEMLRRGLPQSEMAELKLRMKQLSQTGASGDSPADMPTGISQENGKRTYNRNLLLDAESFESLRRRSKIFGSELFSNSNLTFEPDMKMATPKSYVIGPEDELILNVYGLNISQQTLKVSPDGTVNVKYAGVVKVNGLSMEAASALLRSRLIKYYPGLSSGQTKLELSLGNIRSIRVILIGAVNRPGTYTLPSLASLFNALYVSGGPAENGSFRNIELIRNNKVVEVADLYNFLLKGNQSSNVRLEDNDVIRVPYAKTMITLDGELNRPGIFEMHNNETLEDAVEFAGGFKSKAFKGRVTGKRYLDYDRTVVDISGDSLAYFKPKNGDEFFIDSVINRYQNRVLIDGAVFKPGQYALESGMTLKQLINKAHGLKEDVFTGRALVVRTREDLSKEYIAVELKPIIAGHVDGLVLRKEDSIHVASIFDLKDTTTVTINGAVRKPGVFRYEDGLSLKSLILKAEGYTDHATGLGIEISRRKRDVDVSRSGSSIVEIIKIDDNKELANSSTDVELKPFDIVTIKEDPYYKKQISVKVSGEVLMPAVYTLQSREERLSSLIQRSGGLLYTANVNGAKLIRKKTEAIDSAEIRRLFKALNKEANPLAEDKLNDTKLSAKDGAIQYSSQWMDYNVKALGKDSTLLKLELASKKTTEVAIDLNYILRHPGSKDDITLEEGDELIIPRINNTVSVSGEVFKPVDIMYERGKSMKNYLSDAGGVTQLGKRNKAFVIYANGRSAKIKKALGIFRIYPQMEPGSSIFVPQVAKKNSFDAGKAGILISGVTALITAISLMAR